MEEGATEEYALLLTVLWQMQLCTDRQAKGVTAVTF